MNLFLKSVCVVVSGLAVLFCIEEVYAALQGSLGVTSTGSLSLSVTKPARANITNLNDLALSGWIVGQGDVILTDDVCVYSTRPSGGYTVNASGSGTSGAFALANGSNTLSYSVAWNAGGVGNLNNTGAALTAHSVSGALAHASTDSSTCNGATAGPTARLIVEVTEGQMEAASSGTYTGTLTLLITPN